MRSPGEANRHPAAPPAQRHASQPHAASSLAASAPLQDIPKGTELTFDYNFERYGDKVGACGGLLFSVLLGGHRG